MTWETIKPILANALIVLSGALLGGGGTYLATKANASPESKSGPAQVAVTISAVEIRKLVGCVPPRVAREGNAFGTASK